MTAENAEQMEALCRTVEKALDLTVRLDWRAVACRWCLRLRPTTPAPADTAGEE